MKQLSTKEAASYLGMSAEWLVLQRAQGLGPAYSKFGAAKNAPIRYKRAALDHYIDSCQIEVC